MEDEDGLFLFFEQAEAENASSSVALPRRNNDDDDVPPSPLLKRNVSLSKNTVTALESRLLDIEAAELELKQSTDSELLRLAAERDRVTLKCVHGLKKFATERQAITEAIEKNKTLAAASPSTPERDCAVCLDKERNTLFAPCGHVALCFDWSVP